MDKAVFEIRNLCFRYSEATAIDGISLSIRHGERVALLGANGSGKSTLLRLLDGLVFPDEGEIIYAGNELNARFFDDEESNFAFRRAVSLVFQNPDVQLFNPTVFDEVAFGPLQLGWQAQEIRNRVSAVLGQMDIAALRDRSPHRLSGGEKKRVALASVLVLDPQVLLLDEPTAALDPRSRNRIIDLIVGWRDGSKTIVTATHDLDIVEDIADRCIVFDRGRIVASGAPSQILTDRALMESTGLIHSHRHVHASGEVHSHPHLHHEHQH